MQPPLLIYGMETTPEGRGEGIALLKRRPPLPGRSCRNVGAAVDGIDRGGRQDAHHDDRDSKRGEDDHRQESAASTRSFFTLASAGGLDGVVGVGEGLLGGVQHGLHLVQLLPDTPQGAAFAVHGPAGDQVLGDGAETEESVEFFGDGEVLAVEDLDIGQVQQILGDGDGLGADVAGRQRVGGLVPDRDLDVAVAAGESQVGVEAS